MVGRQKRKSPSSSSSSSMANPRRSTRTRTRTAAVKAEESNGDDIKAKTERKSAETKTKTKPLTEEQSTKKVSSSESKASNSSSNSSSSKSSYKMIMILSPAKTLNLDQDADDLPVEWTEPLADLRPYRTRVVEALKQHASSASKLGSILKTGAKITATAQTYWKEISDDAVSFKKDETTTKKTKPAIMTFDGAAYAGLQVRDSISTSQAQLSYLQDRLRIVDPLYGWLRPMDAIEAYRLEMASKGVFPDDEKVKLQDYWKPAISSCLEEETAALATSKQVVVVNVASDEYAAAIESKKEHILVKIVFKHGGRTIAIHAKRARGLMVRYAALRAIEKVDDLRGFDLEGYSYSESESTYDPEALEAVVAQASETTEKEEKGKKKGKAKKGGKPMTLVFDRPETWKKS